MESTIDRRIGATIRAGQVLLLAGACLLLDGCMSTHIGFQFLPERTHYQMFENLSDVEVRYVKHVRETTWGVHLLGFMLRKPKVRETIEAALEGNSNYYVSSLTIHTDAHGTTLLVIYFGFLYLPKVTLEFDVVEIVPRLDGAGTTLAPSSLEDSQEPTYQITQDEARVLAATRASLAAGGAPEETDRSGWTQLHRAAFEGSEAVVERLIASGADVNVTDDALRTPLHHAVMMGHQDASMFLISHGANIHAKDKSRRTPLHCAALGGHDELLEVLLSRGADPRVRDEDGFMPLHDAARSGHGSTAGRLIAAGGLPEKPNLRLILRGKTRSLRILVAKDPNYLLEKDAAHWTPIHWAAALNRSDAVAALVLTYPPLEALDNHGMTALWLAARVGATGSVDHLLGHGANPELPDPLGRTPLHAASAHGHRPAAWLLILEGADASARANDGSTPLHVASRGGHEPVVELLLGRGAADANAKDEGQSTPLHEAAHWGRKTVAALLLRYAANIEAKDERGSTPLHRAVCYGKEETAELLIRYGANVKATDTKGRTPLHMLCPTCTKTAQLLVDNGADVNASSQNGSRPLHHAASQGAEELIRFLIASGADVEAKDDSGRAPLDEVDTGQPGLARPPGAAERCQ
jgi:cytohesin